MPAGLVPPVEPFVERLGAAQDVVGVSVYRFGYRTEATKDVLSAIEIPAEIVEEAVTSKLSISVTLSPTGEVTAALEESTPAYVANFDSTLIPIDALVAQVVAPENLHLEEAGGDELRTLLVRLERSVTCVKDALARCGAR
jgi:hypothetical protein